VKKPEELSVLRADRRVDLSVHPPRVAGAAIGISSRFNPPAALSPQAEQLLKQKAARAAVITALLPADDRAVRRLPAVNEDLWNAHMHGNMDIGPDSDAEGSVKAPPPRTRTPTSRSDEDRRILSVCSAETPHAFLLCLFFEELYTSLYSISFFSSLTLSLII